MKLISWFLLSRLGGASVGSTMVIAVHLGLSHHLNPAKMTTTGKIRFQPNLDDIQGDRHAENPRTHAEHIGVVMFPAHPGGDRLMAECGTYCTISIGGDRHADPGPANQNSTLTHAIGDGGANLVGKNRVIHRLVGKTADIMDMVTAPEAGGYPASNQIHRGRSLLLYSF